MCATSSRPKKKRNKTKEARIAACVRKKQLMQYYDEAEAFCKEWDAQNPGKKCRGQKAISLNSHKWPGISACALNPRLNKNLVNDGGPRTDSMVLTPSEREQLAEVTDHS